MSGQALPKAQRSGSDTTEFEVAWVTMVGRMLPMSGVQCRSFIAMYIR